jgi:hypothetical protein
MRIAGESIEEKAEVGTDCSDKMRTSSHLGWGSELGGDPGIGSLFRSDREAGYGSTIPTILRNEDSNARGPAKSAEVTN